LEAALLAGFAPDAHEDDVWRYQDPPPIPSMTVDQVHPPAPLPPFRPARAGAQMRRTRWAGMSGRSDGRPWWESAVIYQVYPRSFQDSDGDGIGDLAGIERRLDYFVDLGVDALWLSPIFSSPQADFGYDVSDYCGIDPLFGDLAAFDRLLAAAHARSLKLLLDLVPNHSSDRHPWFIESRSSRANPKRGWYIWRDPALGGGPPNNWISDFGGPAWTFDPATGQYYYHAFLPQQPDLNWRNPEVRAAMLDVLRFWFGRGVDGFRIDVLWHIGKHADFPDNPPNEGWPTSPRRSTSPPRCAPSPTTMGNACWLARFTCRSSGWSLIMARRSGPESISPSTSS
jgi:hypothetical protein